MSTAGAPNSAANPAEIVQAIANANAGRDHERLAMKLAKMRQSPFSFLRGACALFYETLPDIAALTDAPLAWCCGDLHFENFGSYKSDNRTVYFDINDFDEAALAPLTWDIVRLLTSILCGAEALHVTPAQAADISQSCLRAYRQALVNGKSLWVDQETSNGLINELLTRLKSRERADFLDKRTIRQGRRRFLKLDGIKALPASDAQKQAVTEFMEQFAATQPNPEFYQVRDIARRIAGTGSLGCERFEVLIEGKGSPDSNYLLDLKAAKASAMAAHLARLGIKQPAWPDEASRIIRIQKHLQVVDHAFLHPARIAGIPFVLKELQPSADRVALGDWGKKLDRLREVVDTMGQILAWDQLRAAGHDGSANADSLIAFARQDQWPSEIENTAKKMTLATQEQWRIFVAALDAGQFTKLTTLTGH